MIQQFEISLPPFERGFHLITDLVTKNIKSFPEKGLLHLFVKHTSAALTINENYDRRVRNDFETVFDKLVPENFPYSHNDEGPDDMPAHIKASMLGSAITIPISEHKLNLGTWQGIYLCEFRDRGGARKLVLTIFS